MKLGEFVSWMAIAVVVTVIVVFGAVFTPDPPQFAPCHANSTCDEGSCHRIDGRALCVRSAKLADARRPACFSVADDAACFATLPECLRWRARAVDAGLAATECADGTPRPADSTPAAEVREHARSWSAAAPVREGAP